MGLAPVVLLGTAQGKQLGELKIVDESKVEWHQFGEIMRQYSMQSPILACFFTQYAHVQSPKENWVVIVCKDRLVHSYSVVSGEHYIVGLTFAPDNALPCPGQGILFTYVPFTEQTQILHLLLGPEELVGSVVPSSVCAPLSRSDRVMYFGTQHLLVWDEHRSMVRAYSIRFIQHRGLPRPSTATQHSAGSGVGAGVVGSGAGSGAGSAGSAMSSFSLGSFSLESYAKVAVINLVREWPQAGPGRVFEQTLDLPAAKTHGLASHDPVESCLYVLSDSGLVRHEHVAHITPIAGVLGFPLAAMATRRGLKLANLLFPQTPLLTMPVPHAFERSASETVTSEAQSNWIDVHFAPSGSCRIQLLSRFTPLVEDCLNVVLHVLGPTETALWLASVQSRRVRRKDWAAFAYTMSELRKGMEPEQLSNLVTCLHLLSEEYTLAAGMEKNVKALRFLIQYFVPSWGHHWTQYYGINSSYSRVVLPCTLDAPPNIYSALIATMQSQTVQPEYPEIALQSSLYPRTSALLAFFQHLILQTPASEMRLFLNQNFSGSRFSELAPAVKLCVIEVAEYLDLPLDQSQCSRNHNRKAESDASSSLMSEPLPGLKHRQRMSKTNILAQALFPADRRLNEAERLLRTSVPQQCAFGAFVDTEVLSDHEIAQIQSEFGRYLAWRALAAAFGRAALELSSRSPVIWEQLEAPVIDFSGECTFTGASIPPFYKTLEQVAKEAPWGLFAHGVALGLSVRAESPGVDSLWVITSAKLKVASIEIYAGLVFGMGLSGHLAGLEEWQFYESLVSSNTSGTVAALLGVAASKRGSRDTKLTKVFTVHIRALLPEPSRTEPLVGPEEERAAIVALGLLYQGQGVRHLTEVLSRELLNGRHQSDPESAEAESPGSGQGSLSTDDDYSLALGLSLGLINTGKANLDHLLPLVSKIHDRTLLSPGLANGALCALLLSYVGSNSKFVASQIQLPTSLRAAVYNTPSTIFAKALVHHLIMWDEIGTSQEWVLKQIPAALEPMNGYSEIDGLWYLHALGGILVAIALRNTAQCDSSVIDLLLDNIETAFYPKYAEVLKHLTTAGDEYERVNYDKAHAAKDLSQLISALCLATAATAAGSGNVRVLQVLRVAHQISPQVQASERPNRILVEGVGIDPISISEAIGWLFMGNGQWSFRNDPKSVGLLACVSFIPLLGGPGIDIRSWHHLRFLWVIAAERRCLHTASDPTAPVQFDLVYKSGRIVSTHMPALLPPFDEIQEIRVVDEKYRPFVTDKVEEFVQGLPLVQKTSPQDSLEARLPINEHKLATGRSVGMTPNASARTALDLMNHTARYLKHPLQMEALRLLLVFNDTWPVAQDSRVIKTRDIEQLKLLIWKRSGNM